MNLKTCLECRFTHLWYAASRRIDPVDVFGVFGVLVHVAVVRSVAEVGRPCAAGLRDARGLSPKATHDGDDDEPIATTNRNDSSNNNDDVVDDSSATQQHSNLNINHNISSSNSNINTTTSINNNHSSSSSSSNS